MCSSPLKEKKKSVRYKTYTRKYANPVNPDCHWWHLCQVVCKLGFAVSSLENLMEVNVEALNVFKHSQGKKGLLTRKNVKCQCLYNERCMTCLFCLLTFTWEESVTSIRIKIRRRKWGIRGERPKTEKVKQKWEVLSF